MKKLLTTILILCLFASFGMAQPHKSGAHKNTTLATLIAGAAQGDIIYWDGTAWVKLNIGSNGQFLTTNGTIPNWAAISQDSVWSSITLGRNTLASGLLNYVSANNSKLSIGINDSDERVFSGFTQTVLNVDNSLIAMAGATSVNAGASFQLAGEDHSSVPGDIYFISGGTTAQPSSTIYFRYRDAGGQDDLLTLASDGTNTQEVYVIRKRVSLSGATDNNATNIFTITTTDETGSADGGMYSVHVHLTVGEATAASGAVNTASVGLGVRWTRIMASAGTGANSAVVEIGETASADEGSGAISLVTVTVTETSEFVQQVLVVANTSGGTFDAFAIVELVYSDFTTAPVIN